MQYTAQIKKTERKFIPEKLEIKNFDSIEPWFKNLLDRKIESLAQLEQWLKDSSELEAAISEDACWRQIRMTCDTENKELENAFTFFVTEIQPKIQPYADELNRKLINNPFAQQLDKEKYFTYLRSVKKSIELFREENISLQSNIAVLQQQYGVIASKMTVTIHHKEYTLQQAAKFLENEDRTLREEAYKKINERRLADKDVLNDLFTKLVEKRDQVAKNADYKNYRDYKFTELGRFDYTKEDCFQFHAAVKQHILPLVNEIYENKKQQLGLDTLRPWDVDANLPGVKPLHPFNNGNELLQKTIACFEAINPFFADCLRTMNNMQHFDLDSRKGKAPGGYNCPLAESGAPFIFMNAAGQMHDVTTMVHEGGHAIHSFLAHPLELASFKEYPMEIAEVASMSMELFSMDEWEVFFDNETDLKRARQQQLERVLTIFPWISIIDSFQHWLYENPAHNLEERKAKWVQIQNEFSTTAIDYSGLENYRAYSWQRQLHLFEVPFYYIEYGIAQLGAIGLWQQFKTNRQTALNNYIAALSLGGTKTLPALYETAGLKFDLSPNHIKTLVDFVRSEMKNL
jgi:oligoendopeptidase F